MKKTIYCFLFAIAFMCPSVNAQNNEPKTNTNPSSKIGFSLFEGAVIAGYVDKGAYLNFVGPNISYTNGKSKLLLGMLPSLRFKEDHSEPKNAFVTPNLGAGLTYCYGKIALQLPFYYNAKTATQNGKWNMGIGIGYRFK